MTLLDQAPTPTSVQTAGGLRQLIVVAPRASVVGLNDSVMVVFARPEIGDHVVADLTHDDSAEQFHLTLIAQGLGLSQALAVWTLRVAADTRLHSITIPMALRNRVFHEHASDELVPSPTTGGLRCRRCAQEVCQGPQSADGRLVSSLNVTTGRVLRGVWS